MSAMAGLPRIEDQGPRSATLQPLENLMQALRTRAPALALLALLLAACGGGTDGSTEPAPAARALPLLDDEGLLMPALPADEPHDPAARTRERRYTSAPQARALESALGKAVILLRVERLGNDDTSSIEMAVMTAYALQAAQDVHNSAPVLVHGDDLRLAAQVVDRLVANGFKQVVLVSR